jgi:Sap, sulfolipid-1-addressing protein
VRVPLLEIALLAVGSMFWPLLLVVVVIALESSQPAKILVWFYLGGFITAVSVGAALVFVLQDSPLMSRSRLPSAPWVDIVLGTLALVAAFVLQRTHERRERNKARRETSKKNSRGHDWLQRLVEKGGPLAFAGGIVGSLFPGPLVILGMADIAQLGYSAVATLVVILFFFVIVFTFIEVPIGGFVVAPEWTKATTVTFKAWLDRNLLRLGAWALTIVGAVQVVRGVVTALL